MKSHVFDVEWIEASTNPVLARVSALAGSGAATGKSGEGNWLQQADISTITCNGFDLGAGSPKTALTASPGSLTVSSVVTDTPVTTNVNWTEDTIGYNFSHNLPATLFVRAGRKLLVEYKFTLADATIFFMILRGPVLPVWGE